MLEILKAFLFGIVEGITEWLPISSTGHMILLDEFIKLGVSDEFYTLFQVVIQLGAILAVVVLYFKKIWPLKKEKDKITWDKGILNLWGKIIVACIPAVILGLLLDDWMDAHLYNGIVVSLALIIYGVIFIIVENKKTKEKPKEKKSKKTTQDITYKQALQIGAFQLLALIPGTSRSGSTILGGLLIGLDRPVITEFTFFLAIPVMAGASCLKLLKYILKVGLSFTGLEIGILLVSTITAFIVSLFVIRFLINYIRKHDFKVFGYYRIVLGILVLLYFLIW